MLHGPLLHCRKLSCGSNQSQQLPEAESCGYGKEDKWWNHKFWFKGSVSNIRDARAVENSQTDISL
jgi:hypothetical protein